MLVGELPELLETRMAQDILAAGVVDDRPPVASAIPLTSRPKSRSASSNNGRKDAFFDQGGSNRHSITKIDRENVDGHLPDSRSAD